MIREIDTIITKGRRSGDEKNKDLMIIKEG